MEVFLLFVLQHGAGKILSESRAQQVRSTSELASGLAYRETAGRPFPCALSRRTADGRRVCQINLEIIDIV